MNINNKNNLGSYNKKYHKCFNKYKFLKYNNLKLRKFKFKDI